MSIFYQVSLLIVSTFKVIPDNIWSELVEGFIDNSTTFYFLFLAPIMIAYSHRATQVITPAATIFTVNITVSNLMDYIFTEMLIQFIDSAT